MTLRFALAAASLVALAACGGAYSDAPANEPALPKVAAPAGAAWSTTITKTPDGGYRMGNPAAPIKLVEYASLTCGHCADFEKEAYQEIATGFVDSGRVSFELRNYLLNPYDVPISLLTRCSDPGAYFALTQQFYQNQRGFLDRLQQIPQAEAEAIFQNRDYARAAQTMGLIDWFKARGVSADQARICLSDPAAVKQLADMSQRASDEFEITGTPSFLINGAKYEFSGWPALRNRLQELGAR